jgi:hypothetical protein
MHSLGREPQEDRVKKQQAVERRQTFCGQLLRLTPRHESVAPPGLGNFFVPDTWGSRPRLNIYRRSAAHRILPTHDKMAIRLYGFHHPSTNGYTAHTFDNADVKPDGLAVKP